ncbi:MAG TPA: hypothetical protein VLK23_08065, partial [Thermodesulfobacteriota bacterium]|nr:hypothetical protein [Thermodesulfobacteriota bacterium]
LAISIPASYLLSMAIPFDPVRLLWAKTQLLYIGLYYLVLSIPFFFTGLIIAKAFSSFSEKSGLFYAGDLLGAGTGSLVILLLMAITGPDQAVFLISMVAFLSPLILGGKKLKALSLFLILPVLTLIILHPPWMDPRISPFKELRVALRHPGAKLLKSYNSPFSRIDLFKSPAVRYAPGLSLKYLDPLPEQIGFSIDGGEINAITSPADQASLAFLKYLPSSLPYEMRSLDDVLILDPKGGLQVLVAKSSGSKNVCKVEGNPLILRIIRNDLREFSGDLYSQNTAPGLGRSFLRSGDRRFDLIDLSLMAAVPSGSFGISEDYRFTVEAFREYMGHLKPEGYLSISLFLIPPPRTELRLLNTLATAMEELGMEDAGKRIISIRSWGTITLLAKSSPFTRQEIGAVRQFLKDRRFDWVYYPGIQEEETNRYIKMAADEYASAFKEILNHETRQDFIDQYLFDIRPVRDENPFFHYYLKLANIKQIYRTMGEKWQYFIEEGYLLPVIFVQVLLLTLILSFLPAFVTKKKAEAEKNNPLDLNLTLKLSYFAFLGIGFMFVEVSLVQKMILPLENPPYAVAAVLASLLISSGLGSLWSYGAAGLRTPSITLAISILVTVYSLFLPYLSGFISVHPMVFKIPMAFLALLPLGLLMGIPFPTGLKLLGESHRVLIPWAWAINGCLSVLAPLLVIIAAMVVGFRTTLWIGGAAYLLAFITSFSLSPRSSGQKQHPPTVQH